MCALASVTTSVSEISCASPAEAFDEIGGAEKAVLVDVQLSENVLYVVLEQVVC